jgi:hypothetical protein
VQYNSIVTRIARATGPAVDFERNGYVFVAAQPANRAERGNRVYTSLRHQLALPRVDPMLPSCAYVFTPWQKRVCMRSKAWLAASVWLRLARLPPPTSRVWRSRRLCDMLADVPGLLAHGLLTEVVKFCPMG